MCGDVEAIVERAIAHTQALVSMSRARWDVARQALEKIYDDLARVAPGHPALDRLRDFIAEQDQSRREG